MLTLVHECSMYLPMLAEAATTQAADSEVVKAAYPYPIGTRIMWVVCYATMFVIGVMSIPYIWRSMKGPSVFDRIIGLNGIGTLMPVMLVLIGVVYDRTDMFIDLAIGIFLLNLILTLMLGKFVREKVRVVK